MHGTRRRLAPAGAVVAGAALLQAALALPGAAAPLGSASLSVAVGNLVTATFPGSGATGSATSQLGASLGGSGLFDGSFTTGVPTSAAPPITYHQVVITQAASGTFAGTTPSNVGGSLAIEGVYHAYGFNGFGSGGAPLLSVPLVLGAPSTVSKSEGGVSVTSISSPWTAGTAVVTGVTTPASTNATVTMMGHNGLTPGGTGILVLVTPIKLITHVAGDIGAFGVLTLTYFAPEPAAALLLGAGVAALAAFGAGRRSTPKRTRTRGRTR